MEQTKRYPDYKGKIMLFDQEVDIAVWENTAKTTGKKYLKCLVGKGEVQIGSFALFKSEPRQYPKEQNVICQNEEM